MVLKTALTHTHTLFSKPSLNQGIVGQHWEAQHFRISEFKRIVGFFSSGFVWGTYLQLIGELKKQIHLPKRSPTSKQVHRHKCTVALKPAISWHQPENHIFLYTYPTPSRCSPSEPAARCIYSAGQLFEKGLLNIKCYFTAVIESQTCDQSSTAAFTVWLFFTLWCYCKWIIPAQ